MWQCKTGHRKSRNQNDRGPAWPRDQRWQHGPAKCRQLPVRKRQQLLTLGRLIMRVSSGDSGQGWNVSETRAKRLELGPLAESRTRTRSQSALRLVTVGARPADQVERLPENSTV